MGMSTCLVSGPDIIIVQDVNKSQTYSVASRQFNGDRDETRFLG